MTPPLDPTLQDASPGDVDTIPTQGDHEDRPPIVQKWIRLDRFDPRSPQYRILLSSLLDNQTDRKATTHLEGEDAFIVLEILTKALDRSRNLGTLSGRVLRIMRSLAFTACQVPTRYMINRNLEFTIESLPFASGGFSNVRKGTLDGKAVAVKVLRISHAENTVEVQKHFCKEAVLWKNITHPNILGLIAAEIDNTNGQCCMISELMVNGNISYYIQTNSVNRLRLLADAADGLYYLHDRGLIHGDIKGHNILITNSTPPRACLSDFGFSAPVPTASVSTRGMNPGGGTPPFMAPEIIYPSKFGLSSAQVSREGDIYAFGMVMYEVITGVRPFNAEGLGYGELVFVVMEGKRPARPANADEIGFENGTWELAEKCWSQDRTQRPTTWDVRIRMTVAAALSSVPAPAGVRIEIASTNLAVNIPTAASSDYVRIFDDEHRRDPQPNPNNQTDPEIQEDHGETGDDSGYLEFARRTTLDGLEISVAAVKQAAGEFHAVVSPTVQEGVVAVRRRLPGILTNIREGFNNFWSPRN